MLFVEGTIGLPDGEDQVEELAHAVAHGNVTSFALGPETAIEGGGRQGYGGWRRGRHSRGSCAPDRCLCDMCIVPGGKGLPCRSTPELFSWGKTPK